MDHVSPPPRRKVFNFCSIFLQVPQLLLPSLHASPEPALPHPARAKPRPDRLQARLPNGPCPAAARSPQILPKEKLRQPPKRLHQNLTPPPRPRSTAMWPLTEKWPLLRKLTESTDTMDITPKEKKLARPSLQPSKLKLVTSLMIPHPFLISNTSIAAYYSPQLSPVLLAVSDKILWKKRWKSKKKRFCTEHDDNDFQLFLHRYILLFCVVVTSP